VLFILMLIVLHNIDFILMLMSKRLYQKESNVNEEMNIVYDDSIYSLIKMPSDESAECGCADKKWQCVKENNVFAEK